MCSPQYPRGVCYMPWEGVHLTSVSRRLSEACAGSRHVIRNIVREYTTMACADLALEARRTRPVRQCLGVLLLSAVMGLLTACGGDVTQAGGTLSIGSGGGGGGGGAVTCVTGGVATMLTWNAVQVATSYRVYFGTSQGNYQQAFGQGVSVNA